MKSLFKIERRKAHKVCRVENLNPERGISSSMTESVDGKRYAVCLCLADRTVKTVFLDKITALEQMKKYRSLYKSCK